MNEMQPPSQQTPYPEGEALHSQIDARHRTGTLWRVLFQVATIVGIIALVALLYNITNQAFGIVAVQSEIEADSLVLELQEERLLNLPHTVSSENDNELAEGIISEPNAIGFFGYAYYQDDSDNLKILSVDGVEPRAATVESGEYPLARPLYLYTTADILADNQAATVFINYYLTHVNEEIEDVGYFPVSEEKPSTRPELVALSAWPVVLPFFPSPSVSSSALKPVGLRVILTSRALAAAPVCALFALTAAPTSLPPADPLPPLNSRLVAETAVFPLSFVSAQTLWPSSSIPPISSWTT